MKKKHLQTLVRLLLLSLFAAPWQGALGNTEGWYHVEVIVFANNTVTDTDEIWPLSERHYPDNMINVSPADSAELQPTTLGQLQELERYLGLWETSSIEVPQTEPGSDFLFESRRTPIYVAPTEPEPALDEDGNIEPTLNIEDLFEAESPVVAFAQLPSAQRLLDGPARSIRRSSLYRLLVHQAWLQPVVEENEALPILIQGGKRYDDTFELDGTITLSRSRFLHLETDLWYTQFSALQPGATEANQFTSPLDGSLAIAPDLRNRYPAVAEWLSNRNQYTPVHAHKLNQSRRMRSSTMHFIDHPQFGLLIRTERYEPEVDS